MISRVLHSLKYRLNKVNTRRIKGNGNLVNNEGYLEGCTIEILGNNNRVHFKKGSKFMHSTIYIKGNNCEIVLDKHASMKGGELWLEDEGSKIIMGPKSTIEDAHIACTEGKMISFGTDCMLAKQIEIRTGDSHSILNKNGERINPAADVQIDDHVWIGNGAKILKGVHLGENSIVATGAIVTSSFPSGSLVGGSPAKLIKSNVNWNRQRI